MGNELRIPFENLLKRGIQREEFSMDQGKIAKAEKESVVQNYDFFFKDIYKQAFTLIDTICAESVKENSRNSIRKETHNVIAVTGRRGTGKTSAMLSIADSCVRREDKQFIALPFIDAAVLDGKEDIFHIVLSNMFKELDKKCENERRTYDFRQTNKFNSEVERLREEMCDIYDSYNLQHTSPSAKSNSSYNLMKRLSEHHSISERFTKLVNEYTEFFSKENKRESYLIICIDDIDMAQQKHIHIMQCIQQYFMIPNIIVLLTLNFTMLSAYLQKDFYEDMKTGIEDKDLHNLHLSFEHTNNYLQKIIPSDKRITMPSWKKYDYRALIPYYINLGKGDNLEDSKKKFDRLEGSVLFEKLREHSENDYTLSPKELILIMLAERTGIYLDAKGNKIHFMEPESLRDLYDKFYILYNMRNYRTIALDKQPDRDNYFIDRDANRTMAFDYLYFKKLPENEFSIEENQLINEFLAEPIERRGLRIWNYYFMQLTAPEHIARLNSMYGEDMKVYGTGIECPFYIDQKRRFNIENYNFGELFRIIYSSSRLSLINSKLIKFILASFSFSLPAFVEGERWKNNTILNNKARPDEYKKLRDTFGYSLLGTWRNDIFNNKNICIKIDLNALHISKLNNNLHQMLMIFLMMSDSTKSPIRVEKKISHARADNVIKIYNGLDPTSFIMNFIRIKERMENLTIVLNSYLDMRKDKMIRDYVLDKKNNVNAISQLTINMHTYQYTYGIVNNSYKTFKSTKHKCNVVTREKISQNNKSPIESIKKYCHKQALKIEDEINNLSDSHNQWFFLEHPDISYNVIKRAVSYILYQSDNNLKDLKSNDRTPFQVIQTFYKIIYNKLKEEDVIYLSQKEQTDIKKSFSYAFINNPVVNLFIKLDDNGELVLIDEKEFAKNGISLEYGSDIS